MGDADVKPASRYVVTGERARQMRVVPAAVLKRLYMRSNKAGAVQTLAHLFLLVAGSIMIFESMGTWWLVLALLLQAVFINALFGAMHEAVHYGAFRMRKLILKQCRLLPALSSGAPPLHPGPRPRSRARHLRDPADVGATTCCA